MTTETESPPTTPKVVDGERVHALNLLNGSISLMRMLLVAQGWATKPAHLRKGKKLRALLPKLEQPKEGPELEAWDVAPHPPIEVPESLRKIGADCLKHFVEKGALGAFDAVDVALTEFGVVEE